MCTTKCARRYVQGRYVHGHTGPARLTWWLRRLVLREVVGPWRETGRCEVILPPRHLSCWPSFKQLPKAFKSWVNPSFKQLSKAFKQLSKAFINLLNSCPPSFKWLSKASKQLPKAFKWLTKDFKQLLNSDQLSNSFQKLPNSCQKLSNYC